MKNVGWIIGIVLGISGCAAGGQKLSEVDKGKLQGYHANEANRLVSINEKNKKVNKKSVKKNRLAQIERLNADKPTKKGKATVKAPFNNR